MKKLILFLLLLVVQKSMAQKNEQIVIGSGGGFTGRWEFYKLKANGEVSYRVNLASNFEKIGKISKKEATVYFDQVKALQLDSLDVNQPGNLSYLIEYHIDEAIQRVIWGGSVDTMTPPQLTRFYADLLQTLIKER
jgi:hypothetical protein